MRPRTPQGDRYLWRSSDETTYWKKELQERIGEIFGKKASKDAKAAETRKAELYRRIGRLKAEVDWLKKSAETLRG
jgi:hypothetical protein